MPAVAALLERRPALLALRRAFPRSSTRVLTARSPKHLEKLLTLHLIDAVVIGADAARSSVLDALRRDYPAVPLLLMLSMRSDDADVLLRAHRARVAAIVVEGLDEPVIPRLVGRHGVSARRAAELLPLDTALGLTDPLQQEAWRIVVADAPAGLDTATLAARLEVARETLSRRFAAGGAPALKRAIDAVRLVAAAQILANPAYHVGDAARLLGFSSPSLLQRTARRTFGVSARDVATVDAAAITAALRGDRGARDWA
jgi:AraC-like DNA-binding protein